MRGRGTTTTTKPLSILSFAVFIIVVVVVFVFVILLLSIFHHITHAILSLLILLFFHKSPLHDLIQLLLKRGHRLILSLRILPAILLILLIIIIPVTHDGTLHYPWGGVVVQRQKRRVLHI